MKDPQMKNLEYEERLRKLKLPTLKYRCMRGDMIETFKIITGIYDKRVTQDILHQSNGITSIIIFTILEIPVL